MDEWNRYPQENPSHTPQSEPTAASDEANEPVVSDPVPPQNHYEYQTPAQQTPPAYNPYGWNQTPYTPVQPPRPPKKKRGAGLAIGLVSGVCAVIIIVLSVMLAYAYQDKSGNSNQTGESGSVSNPDTPTLQITELDEDTTGLSASDIISQNVNSAVQLTIYTQQTSGSYYGTPFSQENEGQETKSGSASGIIMTADGYIITNWHCVVDEKTGEQFPRVDVTLYNGTVYERATIIGADSSTDLAVIKVNATNLQAATFGDSTAIQLGDKVIALGNAGGLGWSASQGIISGLARDVYEDTGYAIKCLQTDAAINPGNSGGPLFNAAGQVIAVNSAKIVASGYEGLGFSIPINEAKAVIDDLIHNGYVTGRVSLGITGKTYSDNYYQGFLIYTINDDSPLANTNAAKGDLITKVNDTTVTSYAELRSALATHKVGDTVTLTLLRSSNRQIRELTVTTTLVEAKN